MADFGKSIRSSTSFARVAYFHYKRQAFVPSSNERPGASPSAALPTVFGLIEDAITDISIEKSLNSPAGTFDITLLPSQNWKQVISPGDWLIIYLYRENTPFVLGNKNVAMIGNVDRVSHTKEKEESSGKTMVRYHVGGRDFGKVFLETDIFVNPYNPEASTTDSILKTRGLPVFGNPSVLVDKMVDVFLNPTGSDLAALSATGDGSTRSLNQWTIPSQLVPLFGNGNTDLNDFGGNPFYNILSKKITASLPGYSQRIAIEPGIQSQGLWSHLERCHTGLTSKLWLDLERSPDGSVKPTIFLRPTPCSVFFGASSKSAIKASTLIDLSKSSTDVIKISPNEIYYDNLGRDDHSSFNMIWLHASMLDGQTMLQMFYKAMTAGEIGLPMYCKEDIMRYGLKKGTFNATFIYDALASSGGGIDFNIYNLFISYLYDIHSYNRLYEAGTIECAGNLNARLGTALSIPAENIGNVTKLYYVEGYVHRWTYPNIWTTTFTVTNGQFSDPANPFIDLGPDDHGSFDNDFNATSLVKTNAPRNTV